MFRICNGALLEHQFETSLGARQVREIQTEAGAIMYLFNCWPHLRIYPVQQVGSAPRVVVWIFAEQGDELPCAALTMAQIPDWELWHPWIDRQKAYR